MSYTIEDALRKMGFNSKYQGEGLRIATFETSRSTELLERNPNVHPVDDDWIQAPGAKNHAYYTTVIYMEFLPKAEVICLPATNKGFQYAINEFKPHIVNMSLSGSMAFHAHEKKLAEMAVLLTSSGNDGDKGETRAARDEWWWAVGAVELDNDYTLMPYSSHGLGFVRSVGIAGWTFENSKPKHGTSFASPFVGLLLANKYCEFKEKHGFFPSVFTGLDILRKYSDDIGQLADDIQTGYGLFNANNWLKYNVLEFSAVPSDVKMSVRYDQAKAYKKNDHFKMMDTFAIIDQNGRTQLPLRVLADETGGTLAYRKEGNIGKIKLIYVK